MEVNYRNILKAEFSKRLKRNQAYSQTSFARDLKISRSLLSEVLKGKHGLSRSAAIKISNNLGFSEVEREKFCDLVDSEHARSSTERKLAAERLKASLRSTEAEV